MNSFRNVELALEFEARRQFTQWKQTGHKLGEVPKETRGWDADRGVTFPQRGKEEASDYRYFPDPDLVPVTVSEEQVEAIRSSMCELPADRRKRFRDGYQLSHYDASVIIDQGAAFADYFEEVAQTCGDGKQACNWVTQDILREMNERSLSIEMFPIRPAVLAALLAKITGHEITIQSARDVFVGLLRDVDQGTEISMGRIDEIIDEKGLTIVSDTGELDGVITAIVEKNPRAVKDFRRGKQAALGPLIGQVMREVKGADPKTVRQMLIDKLSS